MTRFWFLLVFIPLLPSCMVPLGYTPARAQGYVSDSKSAQYLQLSLDYYKKGAEARAASDGEPTEQFQALADEFNAKVDKLCQGAAEGDEALVGDDTAVPRRSFAGIALAEALGAAAQGRSLANLDLEAEYQKVVGAEGASRGLFLANQAVWPHNTVNYRWASGGNPSPDHRQALLAAMDRWSQVTNGRVRFVELASDPWTDFQLSIGVLGCIVLMDRYLEPGVAGKGTIGYQTGALGYIKLDPNLAPGAGLRRTCLHELGHVLGLLHEHKRPDRDAWIDVASGGYSLGESDLGKVDEFVENLRWRAFQITIGPWNLVIYCPVWWKERSAITVGTFDLKSVMIYSGFQTRKPWTDATGVVWPTGSLVPWNTELSPGDVATINALYP